MSAQAIDHSEQYASEAVEHYLAAAAWTDEVDEDWSQAEWSAVGITAATSAVCRFMVSARDILAELDMDAEQMGHDIWLTRNHHGAGFWDRGLGEPGDELTELAHALGGTNAYVGDDGLLYFA